MADLTEVGHKYRQYNQPEVVVHLVQGGFWGFVLCWVLQPESHVVPEEYACSSLLLLSRPGWPASCITHTLWCKLPI